jgi:Zn-dependent protease with chaperone function
MLPVLLVMLLARLAQNPGPRITVVIHNPEAVPAAVLPRAQTLAAHILSQAGIATEWRIAGPGDIAPRPDVIPLHLLSTRPVTLRRDANGYAILSGERSYAGVSWTAVQAAADTLDIHEATLLGAVMAHELGHILLASPRHAANGIMVTRFGVREAQAVGRGELGFLKDEVRRMQAEAERRCAARR